MTLMKPLFVQAALGSSEVDATAAEARMLLQALGAGGGVIAPAARVITVGSGWNVNVAAFSALVMSDTADNGCYFIRNTASTTLAVAAGSQAYNRTQRVIAQVRDHSNSLGGAGANVYDWQLQYVADTGGGEGAEPDGALTLAHVYIPSGASSLSTATIRQGMAVDGTTHLMTVSTAVLRSLWQPGPWYSKQNGSLTWNTTSTWTDFSSGNWAAITFTVPPSGCVLVTINSAVHADSGSAMVGWHLSGTDTVSYTATPNHTLSTEAFGVVRGSKRILLSGLTPGGSDTVTPAWWTAAAGAHDDTDGQLLVEAV